MLGELAKRRQDEDPLIGRIGEARFARTIDLHARGLAVEDDHDVPAGEPVVVGDEDERR